MVSACHTEILEVTAAKMAITNYTTDTDLCIESLREIPKKLEKIKKTLRGTCMAGSRIVVQATCTLDFQKSAHPSVHAPGLSEDLMPVCNIFQDIHPRLARKVRKKRALSGHSRERRDAVRITL